MYQFEIYPDTFATDSQKIVFLLSKKISSACILVIPKPLQNWCLWIAQHWCTCGLKCSSYSQDWAGVLAGANSSSSDLGGYMAMQSSQHRSTKNRLHGKILISHICPNLCHSPQTGKGSADLGTSFQSTEFISLMTCTVSLKIQWDCSQPFAVGLKDGKGFPLFNWGEKLVTAAAAMVCLGSSTPTPSGGHTAAHFSSNVCKAWAKPYPEHVLYAVCIGPPLLWVWSFFSKQQIYSPSWPEFAKAWLAVWADCWYNQRNPECGAQKPLGTVTWRCTSTLGKVFSQCKAEGWGTALFGHPEGSYQSLQWHLATSVAELPGTTPLTGYSQRVAALDTWECCLNLWKLHNILVLAIIWKGSQ